MRNSQPLHDPLLDYSTWKQRSSNDEQPATVFMSCELGAPLSWSQTFNAGPRINQLSDATPISIIDRVIDRQPHSTVENTPLHLPEYQSEASTPHTDSAIDEDDDVWMSAPDRVTPNADAPLSWDAYVSGTPFLTEMPVQYFESIYQQFVQQPSLLIRQDQLVENLVQTMCGQPSICFKWNQDLDTFEPRTAGMRILGVSSAALGQVVQRLLVFGTQMRRLDRASRHCKANPTYYGLTGTAFASCLGDLHIRFQHSIWTIFGSLTDLTVMTIYHSVRTLAETVDKFARMLHLDGSVPEHHALSAHAIEHLSKFGFYIPFGKDLLDLIRSQVLANDLAATGDFGLYRDLCLAILCHTSTPYLNMLNQWLGLTGRATINGAAILDWDDIIDESPLHDPYDEFFLRASSRAVGGSHQWTRKTVTAPSHGSDSFIKRYRLKENEDLPYFVDDLQAKVILRTGCALHLLRRFHPTHPLCSLGDSSLGLRWTTTEAKYNEHAGRLQQFAELVHQYNTCQKNVDRGSTRRPAAWVSLSPAQPQTNDIDINDTSNEPPVPTLQRLSGSNPVSEFSETLDRIMESHTTPRDADNFIPTLDIITHQSIHRPLQIWCPLVNASALRLFTQQFHIQEHFRLLQRFYLFGDESFMTGIMNVLLLTEEERRGRVSTDVRMHGSQWPPKTSSLNMALRAVLLESIARVPEQVKERICKPAEEHRHHKEAAAAPTAMYVDDMLTFGARETHSNSPWHDPRAINALDFLFLAYHVPYPISLVISPRILEKYNRLFTFLLQVHRVSAATKYMYRRLPRRRPATAPDADTALYDNTLHRMRFEIDQFITTLSSYVFDTAVHATWHTFMQQVQDMSGSSQGSNDSSNPFATMDPLMMAEYHEHILDRMLFQCFLKQSQRVVLGMVHRIFEQVLAFSWALDSGSNAADVMSTCSEIHAAFSQHAQQFAKVLGKLHDRGVGRLGNVMNSYHDHGNFGLFGDFYDKQEARAGQGAFARDLLTRLDIHGFYDSAAEIT